jgi:serine/threonine-protein kinase RsbT
MQIVLQEVRVPVRNETDVVISRQYSRAMAAASGFSVVDQVAIATAVSELARNMFDYAKFGEITLRLLDQDGRLGIVVIAHDEGPGIADVKRVLEGGYSTSGGLGLGISGTKRLMDEFEIESEVGKGTTVTAKKWKRRHG